MTAVAATIKRSEVLADMKVKAHAEVASIVDSRLRYLAELGTEKEALAQQCITDASAQVLAQLRPILASESTDAGDNDYSTSNIVFNFNVTARKAGIGVSLATAIHTFIVDAALERYYVAVSHPEMAERYRSRIVTDMAAINAIAYTKKEPTVSE